MRQEHTAVYTLSSQEEIYKKEDIAMISISALTTCDSGTWRAPGSTELLRGSEITAAPR